MCVYHAAYALAKIRRRRRRQLRPRSASHPPPRPPPRYGNYSRHFHIRMCEPRVPAAARQSRAGCALGVMPVHGFGARRGRRARHVAVCTVHGGRAVPPCSLGTLHARRARSCPGHARQTHGCISSSCFAFGVIPPLWWWNSRPNCPSRLSRTRTWPTFAANQARDSRSTPRLCGTDEALCC